MSAPKRTYYAVLGVAASAEAHEIRKAYRDLATKLHPDKQGGSKEGFQELEEAYGCLKDPEKRKRYDLTGERQGSNTVLDQLGSLMDGVFGKANPNNDPFKMVALEIIANKENFLRTITAERRAAEKYRLFLARLIVRDPAKHDLARPMLEQKIHACDQRVVNCEAGLKVADEMLEELNNYQFDGSKGVAEESLPPDIHSPS